jgi:hypothetical protein
MAIQSLKRVRAVLAAEQQTAAFTPTEKRLINSLVAELKAEGLKFAKTDVLVNQQSTYIRLTVKLSKSWVSQQITDALSKTFPGSKFKFTKYKVGGILPYMHWELFESREDTPQTVVFDADWGTMYIQF